MQVDKTTLDDLSIFHADESQSVFQHFNQTQTNEGREWLRHLLLQPLPTLAKINDTQAIVQHLMTVSDQWPNSVSNGIIMVMQKFYDTPFSGLSDRPTALNALLYKLINAPDYSLIKYTIQHAIDFINGLATLVKLIGLETKSSQLNQKINRLNQLLQRPEIQALQLANKLQLAPRQVLTMAAYLKNHFKLQVEEMIGIYGFLDAYLSIAKVCKKNAYCFPKISMSKLPYLNAKGLYHLLLPTPVSYDIDLNNEKNFFFLTGANMAGKSTFIKAVGVCTYLAHLGMGVPASAMELSFFDGLLSNIQVNDNLAKGESFFFNEVQRIKNTIVKIADGNNWLILIDELFKGTNQQDAIKCSSAVIEGFRKRKNALFILSTHLYEIGDSLLHQKDIQCYYFETSINKDQLAFSYQLKPGISNDRLGYLILQKEGVVAMLNQV